jgi:hypothetical protein
VFGFGKEKKSADSLVPGYLPLLDALYGQLIDFLEEHHPGESGDIIEESPYDFLAFVFLIAWFSIQNSSASGQAKQLMSASLNSGWASHMISAGAERDSLVDHSVGMMQAAREAMQSSSDRSQGFVVLTVFFLEMSRISKSQATSSSFAQQILPHMTAIRNRLISDDKTWDIRGIVSSKG